MEKTFTQKHPFLKDLTSLVLFIVAVVLGTLFINTYIFRSFNVEGPSMEKTLYTGDRLIVNRLPVTMSELKNQQYTPDRGQVIVFKNPQYTVGSPDEYIVKRVIAFAGERVKLENGKYTVYNVEHPAGFDPDSLNHGEPGSPTNGSFDGTVPDASLFVSGDHRQGNYSYDSRNGLGYIPLYDVVGPVSFRIFPFTAIRAF